MTLLVTFVLAIAGTYVVRSSMVLGADRLPIVSTWLLPRLHLIAPSVLAALVATSVLGATGTVALPSAGSLLAITAAFVAVRRTGNPVAALAAGLPVYWLTGLMA